MNYRNGRLSLRIDVTGTALNLVAAYLFISGEPTLALGCGALAGLSAIAFAIDGLRDR